MKVKFEGLFQGHRFRHGFPKEGCRKSGKKVESYLIGSWKERWGRMHWGLFQGLRWIQKCWDRRSYHVECLLAEGFLKNELDQTPEK